MSQTYQDSYVYQWRSKQPGGIAGFSRRMRYKLTHEQYEKMLEDQGGVCAICKKPPGKKALCVDHDHACCSTERTCGKCVRGLLCNNCNHGVGFLEKTEWLGKASRYLGGQ
jgi:hypothetical protein